MKLRNPLARRHSQEVVRQFGDAVLIRNSNGQHELIGGTNADRTAAFEWVSLFAHEIVFTHCRVTSDEGDIGRGHMQRFQDVETDSPVILTTSQLLTTGLDAPTCRNVVLVRLINSMVEFKQIIGRGTRVRDEYGKMFFNILDYTGTATRNFADPAFDGDPAFAKVEEIDEYGKVKETEVITPEEPEDDDNEIKETGGRIAIDPIIGDPRKFYYDGGQVEIAADLVYELDADGKQLRIVKLTDYTGDKVRSICPSTGELRAKWSNPEQRAHIIEQLQERGIDFPTLAGQAGKPDAEAEAWYRQQLAIQKRGWKTKAPDEWRKARYAAIHMAIQQMGVNKLAYYADLSARLKMTKPFTTTTTLTKKDLERVYTMVLRDARDG